MLARIDITYSGDGSEFEYRWPEDGHGTYVLASGIPKSLRVTTEDGREVHRCDFTDDGPMHLESRTEQGNWRDARKMERGAPVTFDYNFVEVAKPSEPGITYAEWVAMAADLIPLLATDAMSNAARTRRLVQPQREWKAVRDSSGEVVDYAEPTEPPLPPGRRRFEPVRDSDHRLVGMIEYLAK